MQNEVRLNNEGAHCMQTCSTIGQMFSDARRDKDRNVEKKGFKHEGRFTGHLAGVHMWVLLQPALRKRCFGLKLKQICILRVL